MKGLLKNQSGQAFLEYMLTLVIAVSVVGLIAAGFRKTLIGLWERLNREVAAACPKCDKPPEMQ